MSVHIIYYKDGAKLMRPVNDETEYRRATRSATDVPTSTTWCR